jgi:hypothetical protein
MRCTITSLLAVAGLLKTAVGLGINCEGSSTCGYIELSEARPLTNDICNMNPSTTFSNGQHIACEASICAFLQDVGGNTFSAGTLCTLAQDIVNHGCKSCGSVPVGYPQTNGTLFRVRDWDNR